MTVHSHLRRNFLEKLGEEINEIGEEDKYNELKNFDGKVGLKGGESDEPKLDRYFDSLLPKTAGGLWHELLTYIFLLRNNLGYIIPLVLSQRLISLNDNLIPPDFLIITYDKRIYGVEVGTGKEKQLGLFSLKTAIPTAALDTKNSRTSDRCPICKKWILFCPYVIENYSNLNRKIDEIEVKCLNKCDKFNREEIIRGKCPYTKYKRARAKTYEHRNHQYANGKHYHYQCVLNNLPDDKKNQIIEAEDEVALITHYPYYEGLEGLI